MKKIVWLLMFLVSLFIAGQGMAATTATDPVIAETQVLNKDWNFRDGVWIDSGSVLGLEGQSGDSYLIYNSSDGTIDVYVGGTKVRAFAADTGAVDLPVMASVIHSADYPVPITHTTNPSLDLNNSIPTIDWDDGETSPIMVTFRIPNDYGSNPRFVEFADEDGNTTRSQIDFDVFVNSSGSPWDTSATGQAPVARTQLAGTPEMVTLTVATDFASLTGGNVVTLRVWRDDVATGTNSLEVSYLGFLYNKLK